MTDRPADIFGSTVVAAFKSAEKTFNSATLQRILAGQIAAKGIRLLTNFEVHRIREMPDGIRVLNGERALDANYVFNVTFADINDLHKRSGLPLMPLRYDTFLHFLLKLPEEHRTTAATVIRGPYASLLPSSVRQCHLLASARYRTVRSAVIDRPSEVIRRDEIKEAYERAVDEAVTYLPLLGRARLLGHIIGTRVAQLDTQTGAYTSQARVFENYGELPNGRPGANHRTVAVRASNVLRAR